MDETDALQVQVRRLQAELAAAYERCRLCGELRSRVLAQYEAELERLRTLVRPTPSVHVGDRLPNVAPDPVVSVSAS